MGTGEPDNRSSPLDRALTTFTDDVRRTEASRARRERTDRDAAARLSGTFLGSLVEISESGAVVVLVTRNGSHFRGRIETVGPDVVAMAQAGEGRRVLLGLDAIAAVREAGVGHTRSSAPSDVDAGPPMGVLLDHLGEDRARVVVTTAGGNRMSGRISLVGIDQLVLRLDQPEDVMILPLHAIDEVTVER